MRISDWSSDVCSSDLLEIHDLSFLVPADDVDAVDLDALDLAGEFEASLIAVDDLAQITKAVAAQNVTRGMEIGEDRVASLLRRVDDRRMEDRILGQQRPQRLRVAAARHIGVPGGESEIGRGAGWEGGGRVGWTVGV